MSDQRDDRSDLVTTKLQRPRLNRNLVDRSRLMGRLDRGLDTRLILVCAPAGYGKTTLLSAWLQGNPVRCCWVTLDGGDNDLVTFLRYVVAAIRTQFPNACSTTQSLLEALQLPAREHLTTSLVNELSELRDPVCLVLDDYHEIHQDEIHQVVIGLVRYPSPRLNLVIASRHDPPFSLSRLRGAHNLSEIRVNDLRFTNEEAQQYLEQMLEVDIEPELAARLVERTEGWPVGLRMAALGMSDYHNPAAFVGDFRGDHRYITDYLIDEVFTHQSQPVRTFLLRTSILDRFCAALCDAVVYQRTLHGREDAGSFPQDEGEISSQEILEQLEKSNLFVTPLDQHGEWFRYHSLFRDLLAHRLAEEVTVAERASMHVAASVWLEQNGFVEEALRQRMAASDYSGAARLVGRQRYTSMNETRWQRIEQWLRLFPPDVVDTYPELLMLKAWILYHHGHYMGLPAALHRIEKALEGESPEPYLVSHLQGEMCALRSMLQYFAVDPKSAIASARQSIEKTAPELWIVRIMARMILGGALQMTGQLEDAYGTILAGLGTEQVSSRPFKAILLSTICHVYWVAADLQNLAQTADHCIALIEAPQMPEFVGWGHYHRGCAAYHQNDLEASEKHFAAVVQHPYLNYGPCYLYSACGLALAYQAQNRPDESRAVAASAVDFMLETGNTTLVSVAQSFQAELALRQGQLAVAVEWADRVGTLSLYPPIRFYEPMLTQVKTWLAEDTLSSRLRAVDLLSRLREFVELTHNTRYMIEILAVQALVHASNGESPQARMKLTQAIALARPGGFIRLFVDLGSEMAGLLRNLQVKDGGSDQYVKRILDSFEQPRTSEESAADVPTLARPLTNREMDILALLAKRLSDKEIAEALVISPYTVMTHTRNLFAKLDVHNRRLAVMRARELGLLPSE